MKILRKILIVLLIALIVIQFFRPKKNIDDKPQVNNITSLYATPDSVKTILAKACNDCHSNNTKYPWYSNIQPVAWWLADHVEEGKRELNFDEFATYSLRKQYHKLEETNGIVKDGEMPLSSYTWIHKEAKLTEGEKIAIANWTNNTREAMEAKYPIDSLIRKKKQ